MNKILNLVFFLCFIFSSLADEIKKEWILCTTFPIYQFTRNITKGLDDIGSELLLPAQLGCPHDYILTPKDVSKLSKAKILVINGLGLDDFIVQKARSLNKEIIVVDSSNCIKDVIKGECCHLHQKEDHTEEIEKEEGHVHHHHHTTINPHLFVSPRKAAQIVLNIANQLSSRLPSHKEILLKNADEYAKALNKIADDMKEASKQLTNKNIVQPHDVFDYLAEDIGLEIIATLQPHGQEPSAADMTNIIKLIREKGALAIITEPQYSDRVAKTISAQTNTPVILLDPVASGPEDAPLDYYDKTMLENLKKIQSLIIK